MGMLVILRYKGLSRRTVRSLMLRSQVLDHKMVHIALGPVLVLSKNSVIFRTSESIRGDVLSKLELILELIPPFCMCLNHEDLDKMLVLRSYIKYKPRSLGTRQLTPSQLQLPVKVDGNHSFMVMQ